MLNQIRNEIKEDPETYSDEEEDPPESIRVVSNQQEIFQVPKIKTPLPPVEQPNTFSDFSEIEDIRARLEDKLGMALLKELLKYVDSISDHQTVKFDYEKIEELKMKLESRYKVDEINAAIDSVEEAFTIVVKERLCE